jgi:hypothetical protein
LNHQDWAQIRGAVEASAYDAFPLATEGQSTAFAAASRGQGYRTTFRAAGIEIASQARTATPWRLGLAVTGYGYEGNVRPLGPAEPEAVKDRVEFRRGPLLEWYVNRPGGLEQGFELEEPIGPRSRGPLVVAMRVEGDLAASAGGDGATFADRSGNRVVRYTGLKAWDATGRALASRTEATANVVRLVVDAHAARFPVTVDPTFVHDGWLVGHGDPVGAAGVQFGASVAVSGDTVVVGAELEDDGGDLDTGAAWVFVRAGATWTEQQKLVASDGSPNDRFGDSVSISGNTVVVGAPGAGNAGAAYVFVRSGSTWSEQQKVTPSDPGSGDAFGSAVSVSGDTVVVGSQDDLDTNVRDLGAAYVFVRAGTTWSQQQKLVASDRMANDLFGSALAVDGNTVVVGAPYDETPGGLDAGSAYVFTRSGTTWSQQQQLLAPSGAERDLFGRSVSVSGNTVVVGAVWDDTTVALNSGSACVFTRAGATWTLQQVLLASDGAEGDSFGGSVSISGNTVVVGAFLDDTLIGADAGSAYVFTRSGTTWTQQQKLTDSPGWGGDWFASPVAVAGNVVVAGASRSDSPGVGYEAGSAHVFVRSGATWSALPPIRPLDRPVGDWMGMSVAVSGDTALVGASFDDGRGGVFAGSAYVFVRSGAGWAEQQKLVASDGASHDTFGGSVAIWGDTAVIGARADGDGTDQNVGAAYVFVRSGTTWTQQQKLLASDGLAGDFFGSSVSVSGNTVAVGALADARGQAAGAVYVFVRSGTAWTQQQKLLGSDILAGDNFGQSVSIDGNTLVAGAHLADRAGVEDTGAAYVFVRSGGGWTQQGKLVAADPVADSRLGHSVSISADTVVAGAPGINRPDYIGGAYVFVRSGTTWTQQRKLLASDGAGGDNFGYSVSVSGAVAVVGAPHDHNERGPSGGSAYVFVRSGTAWTEQQRLSIPASVPLLTGARFGWAVAVSDSTIVGGAPNQSVPGQSDFGAAHAFSLPELIFRDGFDPVAATEETAPEADDRPALDGRGGFQALVNEDAGAWFAGKPREDEDSYQARLHVEPRGLPAAGVEAWLWPPVFQLFDADGRRLVHLRLVRHGGAYRIRGSARLDDHTQVETVVLPLGPGAHVVELDWRRSSGPHARDGAFEVRVDGVLIDSRVGP